MRGAGGERVTLGADAGIWPSGRLAGTFHNREKVGQGGIEVVRSPDRFEAYGNIEIDDMHERNVSRLSARGRGDAEREPNAGGDQAEDGRVGVAFLHNARRETLSLAGSHDLVVERRTEGAGNPHEVFVPQVGEADASS